MNKAARMVIWLCSKFTRDQLQVIGEELSDILKNKNPDVKPKDDFKEKHPHYRDYSVDPDLPLTEPKIKKNDNSKLETVIKKISV